ncbi:hypothetical protein LK537_26405 [Lachnoclostridium pacaense]|nr:hypothetical protein [Lachnoclostridium pacaense]MCC2820834.1 hypothetical protein [Lachnoclostridium pacaense]
MADVGAAGGCVCEAGQGGPPAAGPGGGLGAAVARTLGSGGAASKPLPA